MAALLCAKDLCKTYVIDKRQNNVLKNINLEVKEGEMVAIMGPSGKKIAKRQGGRAGSKYSIGCKRKLSYRKSA